MSLPLDENGFFGRECPDGDCLAFFKLHVDDYAIARSAHRLTCPVCGTTESDEHFHTPEQLQRVEAALKQLAHGAMNRILSDFARRPPIRNARGNVTFRWNNPPPHTPRHLPNYVERQTIRTFTCPNGGHRAVIYDLLSFCPYCGEDTPPRAVFDDNIAAMRRLLAVVSALPPEAQDAIQAAGGTTALIERALGGVIAALQTLTKHLHRQAQKLAAKRNPWQNLDRLQQQWIDDLGTDPLDGLDPKALKVLRLGFARRHVLEHNGGIVDERYRDESGEGVLGRRVRFGAPFVDEVFGAAEELADRLEATTQT